MYYLMLFLCHICLNSKSSHPFCFFMKLLLVQGLQYFVIDQCGEGRMGDINRILTGTAMRQCDAITCCLTRIRKSKKIFFYQETSEVCTVFSDFNSSNIPSLCVISARLPAHLPAAVLHPRAQRRLCGELVFVLFHVNKPLIIRFV
jgi:hypothetical protein